MGRDGAALLESAAFQGVRYDERSAAGYQQALVRDACAELGCDTSCAVHWVRNRNADLWKIVTDDGTWLLKILISKPIETLECEYAHLEALEAVAVSSGRFRVPRPHRLFHGRSAYLMEFVAFEPLIDRLLGRSRPGVEVESDIRACGAALGTIHEAWAGDGRPLDTAAVEADYQYLPWTPGRREAALLERLLRQLAGKVFANARLYLDFDPVNIGFAADGIPFLLDPPERCAVDAVQWDLGIFTFGLRRAAWRRPFASRRLAERLPGARHAFAEGYAEIVGAPLDADGATLVGLAEFARLGQLWRWWLRPSGFRHRAVGLARAAYAWPLLRAARRQWVAEFEGEWRGRWRS